MGDIVGGVSQRAQSVLDWLILIFGVLGGQSEVMIQESEYVLRIPDPWQESVPFVCTVHGEPGSLPFLRFGVSISQRNLHGDVEQAITPGGNVILGEGCD